MTSVKGVPPQVPFHVPRRSGSSPVGIVSGGVVAQATTCIASATTRRPFHRGFIDVEYTHVRSHLTRTVFERILWRLVAMRERDEHALTSRPRDDGVPVADRRAAR